MFHATAYKDSFLSSREYRRVHHLGRVSWSEQTVTPQHSTNEVSRVISQCRYFINETPHAQFKPGSRIPASSKDGAAIKTVLQQGKMMRGMQIQKLACPRNRVIAAMMGQNRRPTFGLVWTANVSLSDAALLKGQSMHVLAAFGGEIVRADFNESSEYNVEVHFQNKRYYIDGTNRRGPGQVANDYLEADWLLFHQGLKRYQTPNCKMHIVGCKGIPFVLLVRLPGSVIQPGDELVIDYGDQV